MNARRLRLLGHLEHSPPTGLTRSPPMRFRNGIAPAATTALALAAAFLGTTGQAHAATGLPAHFAAPYLQIDGNTANDMASDMNATGLKYYTLAFLIPRSGCTAQWEA